VASPQGPRTGWSGDGAPGDGSLREFTTGAVVQHLTKTLERRPGIDFRLPTPAELDAIEAFMLSLGRQQDLTLPLPLTGTVARRGQEIFLDDGLGKCNLCHANAGANGIRNGQIVGNLNFDTGVENLPDQPADLTGELVPPDDGFGTPGDGTFNTPPLVEAADTGPFFHNDVVETIEGAVAFYTSRAFAQSPAGRFLASTDPAGVAIALDATQVVAVAGFLRVINALENIRQALALLDTSAKDGHFGRPRARRLLRLARAETEDAIMVLAGGGLHPEAVERLRRASARIERAVQSLLFRGRFVPGARRQLERARAALVEAPSTAASG
jgi:hypothetical protein